MGYNKWKYTITDIKQNKTVTGIDIRILARDLGFETPTPFYNRKEDFIIIKEPLSESEQPINPLRKKKNKPKNPTGKSEKKHSRYNCWEITWFRKLTDVLTFENKCYKYEKNNEALPELEKEIRSYLDKAFNKRYILEMKYDVSSCLKEVKNHLITIEITAKTDIKTATPILDEIDNKVNRFIYEENIDINDDTDDNQLYSLETSGGEGFHSSII